MARTRANHAEHHAALHYVDCVTDEVDASRRGPAAAYALTSAGWLFGMLVTALVLWSPWLQFGVYSPSGHLVLESVDACVAILAAFLVFGRYLRRRWMTDLLLAEGLVLLAVGGLGMSTLARVLPGTPSDGTVDIWLPLGLRVAGAALILGGALAWSRQTVGGLNRGWAIGAPLVGAAGFVVVMALIGTQLPPAVTRPAPGEIVGVALVEHPLLILSHSLAAICLLTASVIFTVRSSREGDDLFRWLGPACAVGGFARIHYALFPTQYSDWLYTGDVLRTGFYLLLLVGAATELTRYWTATARAAVLEDRARLARELHDGLVQELVYVRSVAHDIPTNEPARDLVIGGVDRALDESRAAVHALGTTPDETLGYVLHRAAQDQASRYAVRLEVDVDDSVDVNASHHHTLTRIVREAISNAVRHGGAQRVCIRLARQERTRELVIEDDGSGFDPASVASGAGYGVRSMTERAAALPGRLDIQSERGRGSVVRVTW